MTIPQNPQNTANTPPPSGGNPSTPSQGPSGALQGGPSGYSGQPFPPSGPAPTGPSSQGNPFPGQFAGPAPQQGQPGGFNPAAPQPGFPPQQGPGQQYTQQLQQGLQTAANTVGPAAQKAMSNATATLKANGLAQGKDWRSWLPIAVVISIVLAIIGFFFPIAKSDYLEVDLSWWSSKAEESVQFNASSDATFIVIGYLVAIGLVGVSLFTATRKLFVAGSYVALVAGIFALFTVGRATAYVDLLNEIPRADVESGSGPTVVGWFSLTTLILAAISLHVSSLGKGSTSTTDASAPAGAPVNSAPNQTSAGAFTAGAHPAGPFAGGRNPGAQFPGGRNPGAPFPGGPNAGNPFSGGPQPSGPIPGGSAPFTAGPNATTPNPSAPSNLGESAPSNATGTAPSNPASSGPGTAPSSPGTPASESTTSEDSDKQ